MLEQIGKWSTWKNKIGDRSSEEGVKNQQELMGWAQVFTTIKVKTKEGFEIWMQAKILECVAATTTLGNTLVEYQLLYFSSFVAQGLGHSGNIYLLCRLLWLPHLPHGQTWFILYELSQTQQIF